MSKTQYQLHTSTQKVDFNIDYASELNESQLEVVQHGDGPCLVLAGAGSGKTRTLVYRVAYLLEKGVQPDNILLVTFTNKAAREMLERVEDLLGRKPKGLWGGTFHSVANRLLRKYAQHIDYDQNFGIIDRDDSLKLLKQVQKELGIQKASYIPKNKVIHSILGFAKNSQKPIAKVIETKYSYLIPEVIPLIVKISDAYEARKKDSNVMDFDDLLSNWLRLLKIPELGAQISQQFQYVLVDEFQDTNTVQGQIVHLLAQPQNNILVVGDDAQSIYSFRAASVENILGFQEKYPEAKLFKLQVNYRSSPEILKLANESIRQNQFQYEKDLQTDKGSGKKPILVPTTDAGQQAEVIAQRVLELRDQGVQLDDIAVLFRSSFQIIELELELNRRGIPYTVRGGLRFFEQAHIKDVLAHLHLLQNPRDEMSWRRIMGMYEGVGPATASRAWEKFRELDNLVAMISAIGEIRFSVKAKGSMARLQRLLLKLIEIDKKNISEMIHTVLEQGYQITLENTYDDARDRLEDLHQLGLFSTNYETLSEFLSESSLSEGFKGERATAQEDEPDEVLLLSTIHQAKGLEWEAVFAIGLAEGQFPHYRVMEKPNEMEEERRLFYVTVTRAKTHLYLLYPIMTRSYGQGDKISRPSIFLREVDEDLFDVWEINEVITEPILAMKRTDSDGLSYVDDDEEWREEQRGGNILDVINRI